MPRNGEFQSVHVSANWAEGLPSRELMRRRTLWLTWKGLGRIRVPIWAVKMEIPAEQGGAVPEALQVAASAIPPVCIVCGSSSGLSAKPFQKTYTPPWVWIGVLFG